jgi:hypothetical protein
MLAERAVIGLNASAMRQVMCARSCAPGHVRQVMRARQADTPVKAPATAFLK